MHFHELFGHFEKCPKTRLFCPNKGTHLSIQALDQVWNYSRHKGVERLLLLAIADLAGDDLAAHNSVTGTTGEV